MTVSNQLQDSAEPRPTARPIYNICYGSYLTVRVGTDAAPLSLQLHLYGCNFTLSRKPSLLRHYLLECSLF